MPKDTPSVKGNTADASRLGKIKLAFLYVLIGGLVVSAIISVVAILIGEFNDVVRKALATTFVVVLHSVIVLALVSADKHNQLGKALLPTVILTTVFASMVSSTFGIWQIWASDTSWKAFLIYILVIGSAFLVTAALKLRIAHKATLALVYTAATLIGVLTLALVPWIILDLSQLNDFYFRAVSALLILTATALLVSVIIRRIAISQKRSLLETRPKPQPLSAGMLAVLITVGTFVAFVWMFGVVAFIYQSIQSNYDQPIYPIDSYYNEYY